MSQPSPATRAARPWLLAAALIAACLGLAWQLNRSAASGIALPMYDFVEYWAAGRLNTRSEDPYDPEAVHRLERQAGRTADGVLMWNPPWTLTLVMPFGLLDVRPAHLLWLLLQFTALALSAEALWRYYGGSPGRRWVAWLVLFTFLPTFFALTAGQISPLIVLGAAGFLYCERRGQYCLAGAAAVLLAVKPHLVYLFWLALLLWAWDRRRWSLLAGGALTGLAATLVPLLCNPDVLGQYWHTLSTRPPAQYRSPTLGTVLRLLAGEETFLLQFVAMLPGLAWFAWYWRRHRRDWHWGERMPMLLLVSMLTAAYGAWPFDLVILLPAMLACAARLSEGGSAATLRAAVVIHVAVNGIALAQIIGRAEYFWFIWMTPALLLGYVVFAGRRRADDPLVGSREGVVSRAEGGAHAETVRA